MSLCALFLSGHIRTYKIFREFFRKSLERACPRSDRASIEIEEKGKDRERERERDIGEEELLPGYQSRGTNEPCSLYFPIVITLLVISSLWRVPIVRRLFCFHARWIALRALWVRDEERKREREKERYMEKEREALGVSWELVEYRAWLSGRKYSCFIGTGHMMRYCDRPPILVDLILLKTLQLLETCRMWTRDNCIIKGRRFKNNADFFFKYG